jgi:sulfur carrier protein
MRQNGGMQIHLNGKPRQIESGTTLISLLDAEGLAGRRVAIELNGEIIPRSRHAEQSLEDGDRVEIVHALGGG